MKIPFVKLFTEAKETVLPGILREWEGVIRSGNYILGSEVAAFEKRFADLVGTKHAIGVNSGLDALILSMRALGIGAGDEVITPPNSFLGSAAAIALVGAKPVFADVGPDYNFDPVQVEKAITAKTKAIMPVHLTGNPCQMDALSSLAEAHGLSVIEDAAQAIGATFNGKGVGALGTAGCFSLHPLKNLHVVGDGGMITTDSDCLAENLRLQRNHGLKNRDECSFFSYNSRLDTLQAVVGTAFLELLPETTRARRRNAQIYRERLQGLSFLTLPPLTPGAESVYHVFQVTVTRRQELAAYLLEKGIETKVHYPIPIHLQEAARYLGHRKGDFPVTERLAEMILSLPVRESLTESEVGFVCEAVLGFGR